MSVHYTIDWTGPEPILNVISGDPTEIPGPLKWGKHNHVSVDGIECANVTKFEIREDGTGSVTCQAIDSKGQPVIDHNEVRTFTMTGKVRYWIDKL